MCGRLFQTLPLRRLLRIARTSKVINSELHSISFNVCPTSYIPVIRKSPLYQQPTEKQQKSPKTLNQKIQQAIKQDGADPNISQQYDNDDGTNNKEDRQLTFMKWGQKTQHNLIINGRIEQLTGKRNFAKIIQNRCVVIMQGYYQWKEKQQPFSFKPKNSDHFFVAALYTQQNQIIILTKDATPELAFIHERMPAILTPNEVQLWLDKKNTRDINIIIQQSLTNKEKKLWQNIGFAKLAPYVNKKQQKSIKCLMTMEEYKKQLDSKGLMKFWKKDQKVQSTGKDKQIYKEKGNQEIPKKQIQSCKRKIYNLVQSNQQMQQ